MPRISRAKQVQQDQAAQGIGVAAKAIKQPKQGKTEGVKARRARSSASLGTIVKSVPQLTAADLEEAYNRGRADGIQIERSVAQSLANTGVAFKQFIPDSSPKRVSVSEDASKAPMTQLEVATMDLNNRVSDILNELNNLENLLRPVMSTSYFTGEELEGVDPRPQAASPHLEELALIQEKLGFRLNHLRRIIRYINV